MHVLFKHLISCCHLFPEELTLFLILYVHLEFKSLSSLIDVHRVELLVFR